MRAYPKTAGDCPLLRSGFRIGSYRNDRASAPRAADSSQRDRGPQYAATFFERQPTCTAHNRPAQGVSALSIAAKYGRVAPTTGCRCCAATRDLPERLPTLRTPLPYPLVPPAPRQQVVWATRAFLPAFGHRGHRETRPGLRCSLSSVARLRRVPGAMFTLA